MKVLWLINFIPAPLAEQLALPRQASGSWVSALQAALSARKLPVELAIAAYTPAVDQLTLYNLDGCTYLALPACGEKQALKQALDAFQPDLVQVFGTENLHTRWALELFGPERTLVYIQGLAGPCGEHMADGLPARFLRRQPLKEWLAKKTGGATVRQLQQELLTQGCAEQEALLAAQHVLGRTAWDKSCVLAIHPSCTYHHCGEILRAPFYQDAWQPDKAQPHRIFMSQGNLPLKGLHRAFEALPALIDLWPDTELVIAGWPPVDKGPLLRPLMNWLAEYQGYLNKRANALGIQNRIHWLGVLDAQAMKQEFLRCGVYLMPSSIENSPNSLAEAMLLGVPCAASDVGGVSSMLTHEQEGLLFDPAAPGAIANTLSRIFEDPAHALLLGRAAALRARADHDPAQIAEELFRLYESILKE